MSFAQNLSYTAVQVVHNFGAVATVSGSLLALWLRDDIARRRLLYLALGGWLTQAASGATFGMVSYLYYHRFPDISGIAIFALGIKMACAASGILLLAAYMWKGALWTERARNGAWASSAVLAVTALSSAAFLRWFA
jgi:hypothetical protein